MIRKQLFLKAFGVLVLFMLVVNGYILLLFLRGVSQSEDVNQLFSENFQMFSHDLVVYDRTATSFRFKVNGRNDELKIVVPSGENFSTNRYLLVTAQKIVYKYNLQSQHTKFNSGRGSTQTVTRLKRVLAKSIHAFTISSKKPKPIDPQTIWNSVIDWPFGDSLRLMNLGQVLALANKAQILDATNSGKGTQLKVEVNLDGNQVALFKPQWHSRDVKLSGNVYAGKDRHFGEIAAFYLNLILGYNNGPIIVGRKVNLKSEILPFASYDLKETFFTNKNGSLCFYGKCYFCKKKDPVCADGDEIEGALAIFMYRKFKTVPNPWRRTYTIGQPAAWELAPDFCHKVLRDKSTSKRNEGILDMVAVSIFDFLIGNGDRHHYEMHLKTDSNANSHSNRILLIDNGKSFGNPYEDYFDILAPLFQCCKVREELYLTLKKYSGVLGKSLDSITRLDPLYPLLREPHLRALDRRVNIVLATIQVCIDNQQQSQLYRKVIY